ncbi:ABC transporter substrate-binding protein [Candidatus Poriferisodalis sp.]|uniref:ABC transporter substrate-binding protein n=1 Tax=Candidatus Poriferisodalis sp. TaxID=3101277 RepID=UPI003B0211B3
MRLRLLSRRRAAAPALALALAAAAVIGACSDPGAGSAVATTTLAAPPSTEPAPKATSGKIGVYPDRIVFGQSAALSGPAAELGIGMRLGILAAFEAVNRSGGVNGRLLELRSLDDRYEPEAAIANTSSLIGSEEVFALIGAVGTPTSRSATPLAAAAGIPYVAPFTGAGFLRNDEWTNIVNLRASYAQETEQMVARLTTDLGIERIAVLFQDDSFGRAGYFGALAALERRDMEPVAIGFYPRNTTAIKAALLDLKAGDPQAVIMVGAYEPVGTLISWSRNTGFDPVFITLSFVGANALASQLGAVGEGVLVTQVVPFPFDDSAPIVAAYQAALRELASRHDDFEHVGPDPAPGFVSLEGYLAGRLAVAGLERCGTTVSRQCFLDALLGAEEIDLDGFTLKFGNDDNQGSDAVFLTRIGADSAYRPLDTLTAPRP